MKTFLNVAQLTSSILLIIAILFQSRGSGLSGVFGGGGEVYRTKRGIEKSVFIITIILAGLFLAVSLTNAIIS